MVEKNAGWYLHVHVAVCVCVCVCVSVAFTDIETLQQCPAIGESVPKLLNHQILW